MDDSRILIAWYERIVLSWRLFSEVTRRHAELRIVHDWAHQGWDRLYLVHETNGFVVGGSRNGDGGALSVPLGGTDHAGDWGRVASIGVHRAVKLLEAQVRLSSPDRAARTTPRTLVYRTLAAVAAWSLSSGLLLDPRPGRVDTDDDSDVVQRYFDAVPAARSRLDTNRTAERGQLAGLYWFLVPRLEMQAHHRSKDSAPFIDWQGDIPIAAIHEDGSLWTASAGAGLFEDDAAALDLMALYEQCGRNFVPYFDRVLAQVEPLVPGRSLSG